MQAPRAVPDPSAFYRLNEELARELERLDREGALEPLRALLAAGGAELWVAAVRAQDGLEEVLGVLRPGPRGATTPAASGAPASRAGDDRTGNEGCGCGPLDPSRVASIAADLEAPPAGWDHEGVLAARSRFVVTLPGGAREVYMPDHICPSCWNDEGNAIDGCARTCVRCAFRW